ncbi:hypothetical protein BOTBODRAFT_58395 [Botryobasidium botryosum FD-172 SS1]|uniref:Cep57 centrosome microtubule-binding domain-containing protein n=1 Tax=Botryobasidium botryosum (strain FD-172 SS1) TaxID=930990 RepID=A0A067M2V0_BOTB1|nr:hypothetical protein BOTBODRAFT_58395 [Botryobasidium botryosum FD-172 SS1]
MRRSSAQHSRSSTPNPAEWSIPGDPLEEERIRLENDIQNNLVNHSFEPSSCTQSADYSLEFARHDTGPNVSHYDAFNSFVSRHHQSDPDQYGHEEDEDSYRAPEMHSYRTVDADESLAVGETMSTQHHHASAVTLGAGLGGGYGRSPTRTGAEYDPDRQLQHLLEGRGKGNISFLDDSRTTTKKMSFVRDDSRRSRKSSKSILRNRRGGDEFLLNDSNTIERALESERVQMPGSATLDRHARFAHVSRSIATAEDDAVSVASSFRRSEPNTPTHSRFTDALGRVAGEIPRPFSPVRPRNGNSNNNNGNTSAQYASPRPINISAPPQPAGRDNSMIQRPAPRFPSTLDPPFNITRASPAPIPSSTGGSQFEKMARGLAAEIEEEERKTKNSLFPSTNNNRSKGDISNPNISMNNRRKKSSKPGAALPDVTGWTSAAGSPLKGDPEYYAVGDPIAGVDPAIVNEAIDLLSVRLRELERENGSSRRRVRELELELDYCKAEVVKERTRVLEGVERLQKVEAAERAEKERRERKGKERMREQSVITEGDADDTKVWEARYKEAVEEKKALEALIKGLRSQIARMTSELEEHQRTIAELRELREQDQREITERCNEVTMLCEEVERLAAEVERLKEEVEEGVQKRREIRERKEEEEEQARALSAVPEEEEIFDAEGEGEVEAEGEDEEGHWEEQLAPRTQQASTLEQQMPNLSFQRAASPAVGTPRPSSRLSLLRVLSPQGDFRRSTSGPSSPVPRSPRADLRASAPASVPHTYTPQEEEPVAPSRGERTDRATAGSPSRRYMDSEEVAEAVAEAELEDQQSLRSEYFAQQDAPGQMTVTIDEPTASASQSIASERHQPAPAPTSAPAGPSSSSRRAHNRDHAHTSRHLSRHHSSPAPDISAPFPRIRGEHLERLFFSAPAHDERTCGMCRRRGHEQHSGAHSNQTQRRDRDRGHRASEPEWAPPPPRGVRQMRRTASGRYAEEHEEVEEEEERLPPQTVLARVVRELEDDFAHYKSIYIELADQYKLMDAASSPAKRHVLAEHLKEVVDTLEHKGDQIASLYDLLNYKDKPLFGPSSATTGAGAGGSGGDGGAPNPNPNADRHAEDGPTAAARRARRRSSRAAA